jgi:hypothetical protein
MISEATHPRLIRPLRRGEDASDSIHGAHSIGTTQKGCERRRHRFEASPMQIDFSELRVPVTWEDVPPL